MIIAALLTIAAIAPSPEPAWQVDMIWACNIAEPRRNTYLIQGRLVSADGANGVRRHAMQIVKDESGRFEGFVARSPEYVNPRPGEHWIMRGKPTDAGLILLFPAGKTAGKAEVMLGDAKAPAARGTCEFKDRK